MAKFLSIEVELSQVRVAEIENKGKTNKIRNSFRFPAPQGAVEDGQVRDTQTIGDTLKQELSRRKIKTKKAYFVVGSTKIASREVRIPFVKENRIQSIIEANATDYFPIDVSNYVMSYSIIDVEKTEEEKQYHLMVYAAPKSVSAAYQEVAQSAGLTMAGINCTGDCIYNAIKDEFKEGVHILIKVENRSTFITIVNNGELALQRNVNYGVDNAVETVRIFPVFGRNLDAAQAMDILCARNCIRSSFDLSPEISEPEDTDDFVCEARREVTESLRYLVGNISRIMDYYQSRNTDVNFDSVYCCGLGAEILGLPRLLTNELGIQVDLLEELTAFTMAKDSMEGSLSEYIAVLAPKDSGVNLMEKVTKKQKEQSQSLSGALLVFGVGLISAGILAAASVGIRLFNEKEQERLYRRIEEESSIELIHENYESARLKYGKFLSMYAYTNTPNEGLVEFIEEMEEKMPSSIVVDNFTSTGTEAGFSLKVAGKPEAAEVMIQLRKFESLSNVTTTGIDEAEDGTVSMSVSCTYANPAPLEYRQG